MPTFARRNAGCKNLMESRLIYIANKKMRANITIDESPHAGWVYFGAQPEVNLEFVQHTINQHFKEEILYIAHHRNDSTSTTGQNVLEEIKDIIGRDNFSIWNTTFTKVIDFNEIGVLRCGRKSDG